MMSGICDCCAKAGVPAKREYGAELAGKARGSEDCLSAKREFRSCEPWRQARVRNISRVKAKPRCGGLRPALTLLVTAVCKLTAAMSAEPVRRHAHNPQ